MPLHELYVSFRFRVTVDSSVLFVVASDDDIRYMFKHLLNLRREVETAQAQASATVYPGMGAVEFFGESTVRSETDERDIDMIGRTVHQLATQIVEKIQSVLEERPITNMRG